MLYSKHSNASFYPNTSNVTRFGKQTNRWLPPNRAAWNENGVLIKRRNASRRVLFEQVATNNLGHQRKRNKPAESTTYSEDLFEFSGIGILLDRHVSRWRKFFWLLLFALCATLCFYYVFDRLKLYFSRPVSVDVTVIRNQTVTFPSITFCNYFINSWVTMITVLATIMRNSCPPDFTCYPDLDYLDVLNFTFEENKLTMEDFWKYTAVDLENMTAVIPCETMHNRKNCPSNRFTPLQKQSMETIFGKCADLTAPGLLEYRGPNTYVDLKIMNNTNHAPNLKEAGSFFLHTQGISYRHDAAMLIENLPRGQEVNGRLTIKQFEFLHRSDQPCTDEITAMICRNLCLDKLIEEEMDCRLPIFEATTPKDECETLGEGLEEFDKILKVYFNLNSSTCSGCPRKCQETIYSVTTDAYRETKDGSTVLRLYYADNLVEVVKEVYSYSFPALLSDVGGTLGFLLGVCLINLLQIVEKLLLKLAVILCKHCWRAK